MVNSLMKDIGNCKSVLTNTFIDNSEIMEVILGKGYTETQAEDSVYKQIFPYLYVDETQTETKTYICYEVDIPRVPTGTIKSLNISIWVFCNKSIMKYSKKGYKGTRVDILTDMIERTLRDSNKFGIGKIHLDSNVHFYPNNKMYGRQMIFTISDFKFKEI